MLYGGSTWIWTSPLSDDTVVRLIPHAASLGFDIVELPIENAGEFDYVRHCIEAAQRLGATNLVGPRWPGVSSQSAGFVLIKESL